jgi:hypothetical protein
METTITIPSTIPALHCNCEQYGWRPFCDTCGDEGCPDCFDGTVFNHECSVTITVHDLAVAVDTVLADLYGKIARERQYVRFHESEIERAEKQGRDPQKYWDSRAHNLAAIARLEADAAPYVDLYRQHHWSRFFLVLNSNGHIHRDTSCSTCYVTTEYAWLPALSGLTEADAVEAHGSILCSVCFPTAPVEWTNGESKDKAAARAERDAAKAERLAKKTAKALVPEDIDGGLVIGHGGSRERLKTIAAAKAWLTDAFDWNSAYPRTFSDGTVAYHHPSYPPESVDLVAEVYAARIGSTPKAEIEAARKRAAKRR